MKVWEYVKNSSKDSHGNDIPESPNDLITSGGTYIFDGRGSGVDLANFTMRLLDMGVNVNTSQGGSTYVCSNSGIPGGVRVTCRLQRH